MIATIDDLCSVIVDCEHKTAPLDEHGDYFAVGTPAMRGNVIDYSQARRISKETFVAWTRRLTPESGDLLFAREAPVGPIVLVPDSGNIAPGQRTVLMRPNPSIADSRYLYYLLSSPAQQALLHAKAGGSTVAHLNVADVRSFPLEVPPIGVQRAIAEVLCALDDKIAANTSLAITARALVKAEFVRLMRSAQEPADLKDVLALEYGKPLAATNRIPGRGDVFGSGGIVGSHNEPFAVGPGVVVGRKGTAGAVYWAANDFYPIDTTFYVVPKNVEVHSMVFCYLLLDSLQLTKLNSDSAVPGLNRNEAHAMKIHIPETEHLHEFTRTAMPLTDLATQADVESRTLAATRDALLPQLMSGKLRVRDAEKLVEAVA